MFHCKIIRKKFVKFSDVPVIIDPASYQQQQSEALKSMPQQENVQILCHAPMQIAKTANRL